MAKYRITGVPPFREGGPKRKSKEQVTVSNWDSPVGPVNYNPASLSNFINNTPLVNQPDTYTIDPMYQGVGYQPTSDQITERLFNKVYAPELETKDGFYEPTLPEECSPGTVLYKGECIDESRYYTLLAKDTKLDFDRKYDEIYANVDARLLDQEASENADKQFQAAWEEKYHKYKEDALKKGNKHKKLKPFATFTQDQYDNQVLPAMAQNSNAFAEYYMEKGSDGKINLYPRNVINHLIYDHGVRSGEFKKYHGLNADNIQKEFGDMIAFADYHYKINVSKELRKKISSGLSAEEARKELEKEGWGTADGLTTNFKDLSDQLDAQLNSDMYFTDDNGVMYKKDAKGNVFQYTSRNQWNNNEFSIWNDKSNFKNDYKNKFTWNFEWKPIDKSAYKEDVYGNVTINNNNVGFFDSRFANRKNENPEETILNNYEKAVNSTFKEDDKIRTVNNTQNTYTSLNNQLFDHVYGSNWSTGLPQIDPLINGVTPEYAEAYNKAINEINAITEKEIDMGMDVNPAGITVKDYKDVSGNPDYFQKQKAKILEDFNNKANKLNFKVEGTDISLGNMSSDFMAPKNIKAYKDPDAFKFQKDNVINQEANDYLKLMFSHNILPTEENVMDTEGYRGEQDKSLAQQYGNFGVFSNSPEAQSFLQKYRNQPSYGQTLFDEAYQNKALNLFEDKSKKELEDAKLLQKRAQDKMMMYPELLGLDQLASLVNQPLNTLEKWTSGEWQDPGVGLMSDNGTEHEADKWSQAYGPGGRQLFYNKFNELNENPIGQTINLFNPLHWAAQTGTTAHLKFRQNDPEIGYSDVGLNALFAFAPYSKALRAASGTKLLPKVGALSGVRDYQIARNLATPGNALTGYFGTEAFNLDPDHPGFAIEAGKNIYEGIKEGDTKKISQNILPLGMGLMIGTHGYQNLRDAGKLSTPSLFNIHPTTFDRMYYAPKPPLQKNGGELPKGKYGRITKESKEISKDPIKIEDKTPELPLFFESRPTNALNQFITGTNPVVNSNKYSELFKKIARPEASPTQLSIPFPETLSTRADLNERVPAILPNISESVVPPTGLNLNVTANPNSPLYKAINPKTGKINFDQAISILSKSAGGDEVIHSLFSNPELWQGLGPNVLHMDAKDLLSNVQQAIPSLSRTEVPFDFKEGTFERNDVFNIPRSEYVSTPFTTYGLDNIYPEMFQNLTRDYSPSLLAKEQRLQTYLNKIDARLENEQNKFDEVAARDPDEYGSIWYGPEGGASQYYIQTEKLDAINAEIEKLKNKKESVLSNPEKFKDFQIVNPRTIQFSNLNELGYGLKQHGNPSETLAHSHVYEDYYEPDALYVSQIQSDASEHYSKMKQRHQKPSNATDTELDLENYMPEFEAQSIGQYFSPETNWSNDVVENLPEESIEVIKRNLPQKRVLMTNKKSTEKRLIQEMLQYAAQQGKKYIYIPTSELSTKIQNNDKASKIYDSYKKHYSKLFGESGIGNHTDQFGNNWLRLNVPESYSKGEGVIEAYKDGGSKLPKARYGFPEKIVEKESPIKKPIPPIIPSIGRLSLTPAKGNLYQTMWKTPINNALMNSAFSSLAQGLYKNQNIQPITDMLGSISNADAKYLLTDALAESENPFQELADIMSNIDIDYSNIGDFNRNTLNFANRRGKAQSLLDLGYFGDDITPEDLFKMARTDESMNTVVKNAIDFDRTGYRQVTGLLRPVGEILDGYGSLGQQYNMRRRASGAPRSEYENMDLRNIDRSNPLSIAEYQATSVPMEQYGYRAGVPDMRQQDALYLASLPVRNTYGPYQFKVKQDLDWTGDWKDWMQKYVYDKPTLYLNANRQNDPSKIYFNIGSAKGIPGRATDLLTNTARGTGLHTRQWISGKGNQIGIIDPTFRFMDLNNMSAEDYLDMEKEQEGLIKLFNTGWRGQYKKGGVSMQLSQSEIDQYIKDGYIIEDE